ncbi:MAG: adenylate cyclase [Myxococcota bacterium]|jgi:adenylate cyclase
MTLRAKWQRVRPVIGDYIPVMAALTIVRGTRIPKDMAPTLSTPAAQWTPVQWIRLALLVFFVAMIATARVGCAPLGAAERWTYDHLLLPCLSDPENAGAIVIVEVDDRTLDDLGERWPLRRSTWARFVERAAAHAPAAIILDVVFDQSADTDAVALGEAVAARIDASGVGLTPAGAQLSDFVEREIIRYDADQQLSQAIANAGRVVLGAIFTDDSPSLSPEVAKRALRPLPKEIVTHTVPALAASSVIVSHPRLVVSAWDSGALNVVADPDGVVRRYPYSVQMGDARYSSLALAALGASGQSTTEVQHAVLGHDGGMPLLRFRDMATGFERVSFSDVLLSRESSAGLGDLLRGKMLFVGATAVGVEDMVRTPFEPNAPGVIVHATATENLLRGSVLRSEGRAFWLSLVLTALLLILFVLACRPGLRPRTIVAIGLALIGVHSLGVYLAAELGLALALTPLPFGIAALGVVETVRRWRSNALDRRGLRERERLLETERDTLARFQLVVDNVADAIVTVGPDHCITWVNPAAQSLFRRHQSTLLSAPIETLIPAWTEGPPLVLGSPRATSPGRGHAPEELQAALPDGTMLPVEATVTMMPVAGASYLNCVFRNIAQRKALERRKEDFFSTVNHELRTPVTSILGSLQLVDEGAVGPVDPSVAKLVSIAVKNGERLLGLVNDLLDVSSLEQGPATYALEPLVFDELVSEAVAAVRGMGTERRVTIAFEGACADGVVSGNERRLGQVMANLLSNAVKHAPEDSAVEVRTDVVRGWLRVLVRDHGPGIPAEARPHLFEKFSQTAAGDGQKRPGTGLGLHIARSIVVAHGGRIGFDSVVHEGATFYAEFPRLM